MRLLDQIAASTQPLRVAQDDGSVLTLAGAAHYARAIAVCPLRYVLDDAVTESCVSLAFSAGMGLADCFDLLRLPAENFWVEWCDRPRQLEVERCFPQMRSVDTPARQLRAGAWVRCDRSGRSGALSTFWSDCTGRADPQLSPLVTQFNFDQPQPQPRSVDALFDGEAIAIDVCDDAISELTGAEAGLSTLLAFVRFRLQKNWLEYYRQYARTAATRRRVLVETLSGVATDLPLIVAFSLLINARGGLRSQRPDLTRLNQARSRDGKPPLLEHIEVTMPLHARAAIHRPSLNDTGRQSPRFHHVRGHLVRRADQVYWRSPHWRGALRLGRVRTRTVSLSSTAPAAQQCRDGRSP